MQEASIKLVGCIERQPINGKIVGEIIREPYKTELGLVLDGSSEIFFIDKELFESKFILGNS